MSRPPSCSTSNMADDLVTDALIQGRRGGRKRCGPPADSWGDSPQASGRLPQVASCGNALKAHHNRGLLHHNQTRRGRTSPHQATAGSRSRAAPSSTTSPSPCGAKAPHARARARSGYYANTPRWCTMPGQTPKRCPSTGETTNGAGKPESEKSYMQTSRCVIAWYL